MNPNWRTYLEKVGAAFDPAFPEVLHFGDAAGELQAAGNATVLVPLTHLAVVECIGEDAKAFLHNQLTSDINHLIAERAQHSAWCSAKGRMLASFLAWRDGEAYDLAMAAELAEPMAKRLQMFVLRSKVKVADLSDSKILLGVSGPRAGEALAAAGLPAPADVLAAAAGSGCQVIRLDTSRFVLAASSDAAAEMWTRFAPIARPAGVPVWRWLDVQAGLPLVTGATREEFVPQMADFEKMGGVSFHKGCYPGQEVVARTQYLGKVKRHLYRLASPVALKAGDDLYSPENPDQTIGKVVSAAPAPTGGFAALAVIQSNYAQDVHLGALDGTRLEAQAVNP